MRFILKPDLFLVPQYRISPFINSSIDENNRIENSYIPAFIDYCNWRFGINNWMVTKNGRQAINLALELLGLTKEDGVMIKTTSQNSYISGCVTKEIEKFCSWSMELLDKTRVVFINHEFGYPLPDNLLRKHEFTLPIIEDCCTAFFIQNGDCCIEKKADFSIYSFPKFFPIQLGGLLVGNGLGENSRRFHDSSLTVEEIVYIQKVVGFWISNQEKMLTQRNVIFEYATMRYSALGFSLRFPSQVGVVPSVLLLKNNGIIKSLQSHKSFLHEHGIQNSVFYGEDAFFIPCHQNLTKCDVDYFIFVSENYIKLENDNG